MKLTKHCQGACGISLLGGDTQKLCGCGHGLVATGPWRKSDVPNVPAAFCCNNLCPVVLGLQPGPHHDPFSFASLSMFELKCCGTSPEMGSVAFHSLDDTRLPTAVSCVFHNKLGQTLLGLELSPHHGVKPFKCHSLSQSW